MKALLSAAGRAFLRVFLGGLPVLAIGILAAPNLNDAYLFGVVGLCALVASGIRAIQAYIPQFSVAHYVGEPYGKWVDAFAHGFLGSLAVTVPGLLDAPNLILERGALTGLLIGATSAGVHVIQSLLTPGEQPAPRGGIQNPPNP